MRPRRKQGTLSYLIKEAKSFPVDQGGDAEHVSHREREERREGQQIYLACRRSDDTTTYQEDIASLLGIRSQSRYRIPWSHTDSTTAKKGERSAVSKGFGNRTGYIMSFIGLRRLRSVLEPHVYRDILMLGTDVLYLSRVER